MNNMFGVFELIIGAYAIYGAATGKGQLFRNENIKEGKEQAYVKGLRILAAILGPVMLALGGLDMYISAQEGPVLQPLFTGLMIASGVLIALMVIHSVRMTDRKKAKTAQQRPGGQSTAPRAAFEFDEEDAN